MKSRKKTQLGLASQKPRIRAATAVIGVAGVLSLAPFGNASAKTSKTSNAAVTFSFKGLPRLGAKAHYEAWAETNGRATSMGAFAVSTAGKLTKVNGTDARFTAPTASTRLFVTIEPANDSDAIPSGVTIASGAVVKGKASLSSAAESAVGTDFKTAKGTVLVAAPTAPKTDPLAGVWWYDPTTKSTSITIPPLGAGWVYEGWVVLNGQAVTTGQFSVANEADRFNGYSGEGGVPAVPGEDFVKNAPKGLAFPLSVAKAKTFITVEPTNDGDPAPFAISLLTANIPEKINAFESVPMLPVNAVITGSAVFR